MFVCVHRCMKLELWVSVFACWLVNSHACICVCVYVGVCVSVGMLVCMCAYLYVCGSDCLYDG